MSLAVFDLGFAGIHLPLVITPRSDNLDVRGKSLDTEFKTDLVISLTGSTVTDGNGSLFAGNFH